MHLTIAYLQIIHVGPDLQMELSMMTLRITTLNSWVPGSGSGIQKSKLDVQVPETRNGGI